MSVTRDDVMKVAKLANISVDASRLDDLARELSSILGHMEELNRVDTERVDMVVTCPTPPWRSPCSRSGASATSSSSTLLPPRRN